MRYVKILTGPAVGLLLVMSHVGPAMAGTPAPDQVGLPGPGILGLVAAGIVAALFLTRLAK